MVDESVSTKPLMMFVFMVVVIFVAELTAMTVADFALDHPFELDHILLDATVLVVIISPMIYFRMIRPLLFQIAERRKAEDALTRAREQEFRTILRTTMDGFWITDCEGRIVEVNDVYCRMTGYSRNEVLRMSIADFEAVESHDEVLRHVEDVKRAGFDRFETRHWQKHGGIIDMEVSVNFHEEDNKLFVFLRDISQRKKYENDLYNSKVDMEKLVLQRTEDLNETNRQLLARTVELEERNRWTTVLRSLGDMLQSCMTTDEV